MAGVFKALYCLFFRPFPGTALQAQAQLRTEEELPRLNAAVNGVTHLKVQALTGKLIGTVTKRDGRYITRHASAAKTSGRWTSRCQLTLLGIPNR